MHFIPIPIDGLHLAEFDSLPSPRAEKRYINRDRVQEILRCIRPDQDNRVLNSANGKPFLHSADRSISISHSSAWVAVYLSDPRFVLGVDVEQIGNKALRLHSRFCNRLEQESLLKLDPDGQLLAAHIIWSAKETAYKIFEPVDSNFIERFYCDLPPVLPRSNCLFDFMLTYSPISGAKQVVEVKAWIDPRFVLTAAQV